MSTNFSTSSGSRAITLGIAIIGSIFFAVLAGNMVASGQYRNLLLIATGAVAVTVSLLLGKRYWILIPFTFSATGSAGALPLPFNYAELGVLAAFSLFIMHVAFKKMDGSFGKPKAVDMLLALNIAYLLSVFVRNPVGVRAMQTELVGGRPYFSLLLAFLGYIVLATSRLPSKNAKYFTLLCTFFAVLPGLLVATSDFIPGISRVVYPFYSSVNIETFRTGPTTIAAESERITSLTQISKPVIQALCAYFPPATLVNPLYPGRFAIFAACLVMVGLSGFRNHILSTGAMLSISGLLRRQLAGLVFIGVTAVFAIFVTAVLHQAGVKIPFAVQRSLSFLPLEWDSGAVADAQGTVEWRQDMWKAAWNSPTYMRNKIFGDGFGFTQREMMIMSDIELGYGRLLDSEDSFEGHLIRGSFHNGPLSAIKFVGFVGLFFFTVLMIAVAAYSIKVVKRAEGTPYYVMSLFFALPVIYQAFEFYFIFGAYQNAMILTTFTLGMLKLIDSSMAASRLENTEAETTIPLPSPRRVT